MFGIYIKDRFTLAVTGLVIIVVFVIAGLLSSTHDAPMQSGSTIYATSASNAVTPSANVSYNAVVNANSLEVQRKVHPEQFLPASASTISIAASDVSLMRALVIFALVGVLSLSALVALAFKWGFNRLVNRLFPRSS